MFIKSLRRLFIAACIFLVVDSPSSPSSLSISSTSEIQKPWSFPLLGPSVNLESEVNDTHVLDDITLFAVDYSIFAVDDFDPSIHEIPHNIARVMTPFQIDFSDLDINVLEMMVPAVCAITHTIRKNPTMVVTTIVVEGVKLVLKLGGLEAQVGLGLGEEVEKLDKLLASTVLRLAIDLVLGTLAVLFSRKRCRRAVKVFGRHAREVDGWLAEHLQSALLAFLIAANIPQIILTVSGGILAVCCIATFATRRTLLKSLDHLDAPAPAPPAPGPRKKKKRWY